jgi:hypothetical protein
MVLQAQEFQQREGRLRFKRSGREHSIVTNPPTIYGLQPCCGQVYTVHPRRTPFQHSPPHNSGIAPQDPEFAGYASQRGCSGPFYFPMRFAAIDASTVPASNNAHSKKYRPMPMHRSVAANSLNATCPVLCFAANKVGPVACTACTLRPSRWLRQRDQTPTHKLTKFLFARPFLGSISTLSCENSCKIPCWRSLTSLVK